MKKNYFKKILCILYLLLISINISHARNLSGTPTPTAPIHNIQYKVISFFADLFSDNQVSKIYKTKRYNKSVSNYKLTSSSTSFALAAVAATGDFRSKGSGNWNNPLSWEVYNSVTGLWTTATEYPGQNVKAPLPIVTIVAGQTITVPSTFTVPNEIGELQIFGTLIFGDGSSTQHNIEIKSSLVTIESTGILNFNGPKIKLTLPNSLAVIAIESGGNITGDCTNNDEIFIGTKKFAVCAGAGAGGTFTFGELVASGGNINSIITIPNTSPITVCNGQSVSIQGKYASSGGVTNVTYEWVVRDPSNNIVALTSGNSTGTLATTSSLTTAATIAPTIGGDYLVSLKVTTTSAPIITNIETNIIKVQTVPTPGIIGNAQTICNGGDPTALTSTTAGTGDQATVTYRWESTTSPFSTWNTIGSATAATYDPSVLTTTTRYRRYTISTVNGTVCESTSPTNSIEITVQTVPTAGTIGTNQTICSGTAPVSLTSTTSGSGSGTITYEWQTNASGSYADIPSANAATYQPPSLTTTTSYQRRTVSTLNGVTCYSAYTTPVVITVSDTTPPVITCPANANISCEADSTPASTGTATATDNCDTNVTVSFSDSVAAGTGNNSVITRTWTATDDNSNSSSCVQTITITDTTAPVITCPANANISCEADSTPASTGTATATDNCDTNITVSFSDSVAAGTGNNSVITRTWTATDDNSNSSSCVQTITITDTTAPVITCPANANISCEADSTPASTGTATATDNCDTNITVSFSDSVAAGTGNNSVITRTWTATDDNSNSSSCVQTITITDTTAPVITCPANANISCEADSTPASTGTATATDNCDTNITVSFSDSVAAGTGNNSVITRTWTATDDNSNSSSCVQTITITDTTAPVITCPANANISCEADSTPASTGTATATDNCDTNVTVSFSDSVAAGTGNNSVITRTWTATDDNSNSSSCVQTITITDTTAPVITCPANANISCEADSTPASTGTATATDNCDTNITVSFSDSVAAGTGNNSVITRTWTATDDNSNSSSCVQTITITDTTAPVITCPANANISCEADSTPASTGTATATDNCDTNITVSFSDSVAAGTGNNSVITRTWTATDDNSNSSSCVQTITITDTTAPVITCPANANISCEADSTPASTGTATATDNCDTNITVSFSDSVAAGTGNNSVITRTWTATDDNSNSSSCVQTITITDTTAPVITCPANANISCEADSTPASTGTATATDNCDTNITVSFSDSVAAGTGNNSVITRTWTATDDNSNSSSCVQTITITDTTAPVITCPANANISCEADSTPASTGTATATDNCDTNITVSFSDSVAAGTGNNSVITRTWTATDDNSNSSSCVQTITITDTTAPVITCPANANISCEADSTPASTGTATATDNCDTNITVSFSDSVAAGTGNNSVITRTWTATDDNSNSSSCVQTITITDTTAPVITCPANANISCEADSTPASTGTATATDNCDTNVTVSFSDSVAAGTGNNSVITRTWTATDDNSNSSSCVQTITITDTTAPVITCPANANISCEADSTPASTGTATATDNCDTNITVSFSDSVAAGTGNNSVITRTWTATDDNSNSSSCVQTITITDTTAPVITCPANANISCEADSTPASTGTATATDNCDTNITVSFSDSVAAGTGNNSVITRTWTATDDNSNSSSCVQTITITDTTAPVITCPANANISCEADSTPASTGTATATDNCDTNITVSFSDSVAAGTGNNSVITRTWTATDDNSNSSSCVQTITITDTTAPVITCPANANISCEADSTPASTGTATATDNCDTNVTVSFSDSVAAGTGNNSVITRTWTATDDNSNSSSCVQTITITDTTAPVITCPANANISCEADSTPASTGTATATDNCDTNITVSFSDSVAAGTGNNSVITRTWTATDDNSNSSSCVQTITITDTTAPVITCPANANISCEADSTPASTGTATATDNCDTNITVSFSDSVAAGTGNNSVITRTWTATDDNSNSSSCVQTITITDTTAPVITCPADLTIQCTASKLPANTGTATATDNCDTNVTITYSDVSTQTNNGSCTDNSYTITRTWLATDDNTNSISCDQIITIIDTTPPVLAGIPANTTVQCHLVPVAATPTATDNCDTNVDISFSETSTKTNNGTCTDFSYSITRTWVATDNCGLTDTKSQTITVIDTTPPSITTDPSDYYAECDGFGNTAALNAWLASNGGATATDNCSSVTWSNNFSSLSNTCGETGSALVTFTATDACGNPRSRTASFIIEDKTIPFITNAPQNLTVECDGAGNITDLNNWLNSNGGASATDSCSNVTWSNNFSTLSNDCGSTGSATVTFTATDDCGNPNSRTATFTIIDSTDPTASNPAPINVQCKSAIPAVDTSVVTDENDNCSMPTVSLFSESNNSGAGTTASPYIVTRIYRVTDDCGRFINVSQTITAIDDTPPTITCPSDINQNTDSGICGASLTIANPTVSDNCSSTFTYSSTRSDNEPLNAVFPVGTTTITWTATDEAGNTSASCTQTVSITDNEPPVASCKNITIALDPNSGTASITANQINNNSTDNCSIQSLTLNKTSFDCTNIGSNPVVLTVTDANGNASTCTATVTVTDLSNNASVTINATQTEFCAQATATFTAIPTSGGSNPTYQWKINGVDLPGETGVQFTSSNTLNNNDAITVEMTSNVSFCTKTVVSNPLTVTVNAERVVSFNINASASQTCEGGNITYSVNPATITNGGTNPSYQWKISTDGGATYTDITGATSASYTRSNMPLTDNGDIIALEVTSNVQCADPTLNNNPITMVVNTLPTVTAPSDFSICLGNSVTLTGSGASTYTWNNGVTNGVAFYPTTTQTYTVTGIDANGCQDTDTVTVTVNPLPQVTASTNSPVCLGDLIDLTASFTASGSSTSGVTWSWTGPNGFTSGDQNPTDFTAVAASAGDYTVTVTDNNGCVNMDTVTLVINPDTTISSHANQTQSVCINNAIAPISFTITNGTGASITAGGLPPGVNGTYSSGAFNISGTPTSSGTFAYTVTATGLCAIATQSGTITVNPDATINLTTANANQTVCEGVAIGDIQYTIAGGGTGAIVTGLPSGITWGYNAGVLTISGSSTVTGTHNFTVNTTGTCNQVSANGSITINPNLTPSVSIISNDADNNICSGSPVMFTATPVNGGSTPIYQWKVNGNDVGTNSSNFTSSTLSDGDIVTVVLTTSENCYTSATATSNAITNNVYTPLGVQIIDGPSGVCPSGIVTYSIPENNNNILTYNWTVPFGFIIESGQGTHEITVSFTTPNEGLNTISVVTTNPCGSVTSSNTEINVQDFAAVNAGPDRYICAGTSSITLAGAISGAVEGKVQGNNKWDWTFTHGSMSNPESKKLDGILTGLGGLPAGTVITVTISTNSNVTASCIGTETDQMNIYILGSGAITSPSNSDQTVCINETINPILFNINHGTGATVSGLPSGLTGNYSGGVFTISGTPTQSGIFNYTVNTNVGCSAAAKTGTITVHPNTTINNPANKTQTICINDNIAPISFNITNGTGATVTGLPNNLSGTYNNGIFTISGQALQAGTFNYTVNTEGNCAQASQTGTITVNPDTTISGHANQSQSVCINTAIAPIIFNITNGTGASITSGSLPAGVTGSYSSGAFTISGTPTVFGDFDYTVTATGTCASATQSGTITVNPDATITLTTANNTQSVCENQSIAPILYTIGGGGTGATVTGLPTGINYSFNSGVLTISGDSAIAGTHNFTVNTTGTCAQTSTNGSITINLDATIDNPSNKTQTVCINNAITPILFTITDATGATASGLPNGVTGNYSGGVFTISGTPTESGNFSYTVNTQGTCVQTSQTGSITVNPDTTIDDSLDKNQTVCINTSISTITFNITNGTGATVSGLPNGVTGSYSGSDFVIDGTPTEAGTFNYTVTTQGNCDQASESGTITIKEIAVISTQPQNVGVCVNTNTSLSVVAYGGITGYQWYRNGVAVSGATSNILNFSPATLANAGSYYVEILGDSPCSNVTSDTVTLNVNQLISITDQPDDLSLCEGTTATFTVTATGDTPSYQWRKDGTNILGATNASFVINNVSPADIGNYDVVITGSGTCPSITSETASLNVTQQPTASISYDDSEYCKSFAGSEPINLTGTNNFQGGNFGSSPAGLILDSSTGAITPSASAPGTYTVTYTMPASVCSISPVSTTVTIYPNTVAGNTQGYLDTETIADARTVLTVCHEGDGTIFASGYTGTIIEWQISTDGGLNWSTYSATSDPSITFTNLTDTTLFRAAIESGNCGIEYSLRVLLNVIPPDVKPDPVSWSASTICIGDSVTFIAQSGLGTGLGLEDGGGDFNTGQLNTQDPDSWLVDGNPGGWTANADTTKPSIDWSGSNPHVFGGILYDTGATSGPKKFGIVYGPADSDGFILETPIFNTYGLTAFEFQMDQAWNLFAGDQILIELSLDGGTTYGVTLQDITGPNSSGNHDHFGDNHFVFTEDVYGNSLISYLGQDDLRIRFTYLGTNPTSSWAIDDIQFEVDDNANGIEWTDEFDEIISTENTAMVTPEFPGKHTYGVTSLINGCRSEGIDGTVFVDIDVIYAHAGPDQSIPQSNCGNNVVTLNAYDNTLNVAENFVNGAYVPYDINDPESQFPGTGHIGTWSITSGPTSTCGTGTFSDVNDPRATFTGEPGTYVLRWTVGNCWDEVTIVLTSCDTIDFDGINDHINFKKNYDLNNAFSIEVWIKTELNSSGIQTILSKRNGGSLNGNGYDLRLVNRRISFNWNNGNSLVSNYNINTDRWYHVAVTFDGATYKLYIDGIEVGTPVGGSAPSTNNFDCILGAMDQNGQPLYYFNGWMDELRIWNKALHVDHIRQMMNQQIISSPTVTGNVQGEVLPMDIHGPDNNGFNVGALTDNDPLLWSNLQGYYRMDNIGCGNLLPYNGIGVDGKLRNINSIQEQSAPLPYTTIPHTGYWNDTGAAGVTPWTYGNTVWDYPNSMGINNSPIDWNIVKISNNVKSANQDITLLGLIVDPAVELEILNPTQIQNENNNGQGLWVTHYLKLDGWIDLIGESQLVQKRYTPYQFSESILDVTSAGYLERDQQGAVNLFNYNYWSSPVGVKNTTSNNNPAILMNNKMDGTISSNPKPITWIGGHNASATNPVSIPEYWLWAYENFTTNTYGNWVKLYKSSNIKAGLGYTMKGSGSSNAYQNYTFTGKPNNNTINRAISLGNEALVGNPYPSAIDAQQFIKDNIPSLNPGGSVNNAANPNTTGSIDGSLYFWIHYTTNNTHVLRDYQGGYATYTLVGGVAPVSSPLTTSDGFEISGAGSSNLRPGQYIPVAQGFFVYSAFENKTSNQLKFQNSQRVFKRETNDNASDGSQFLKSSNSKSAKNSSNPTVDEIAIKRLRLQFKTPEGARRHLLLAFTGDNAASDGFDYGYDAKLFETLPNDMFFMINNDKCIIQGVGAFDENKQYPFGISSKKGGAIEISITDMENLDPNTKVYIFDSLLGTYTKINDKNSKYETTLGAGDHLNRFRITFVKNQTLSVVDNEFEQFDVKYLNDSKEIQIKTSIDVDVKQVYLINILGQTLKSWNKTNLPEISNNMTIPMSNNFAEGTYIIKVVTSAGTGNKKIIIN